MYLRRQPWDFPGEIQGLARGDSEIGDSLDCDASALDHQEKQFTFPEKTMAFGIRFHQRSSASQTNLSLLSLPLKGPQAK
jgi:hypothetical protein